MDTLKEMQKAMVSSMQLGRVFIAMMLYVLSILTLKIKRGEKDNKI